MVAGRAINLRQVAPAEILDPRGVKGSMLARSNLSGMFYAWEQLRQSTIRAVLNPTSHLGRSLSRTRFQQSLLDHLRLLQSRKGAPIQRPRLLCIARYVI